MLVPQKRKQTLLPLLVVLFLVSYGLLSMLVVEQGRTIDNQRTLIQQLFQDSTELSAIRNRAVREKNEPAVPRSQAQAPSSQETPNDKAGSKGDTQKLRKQAPLKPPKVTSDIADQRRALISI